MTNVTNKILTYMSNVWNAVTGWFDIMLRETGMLSIVMTVIIAMLVTRFLIMPVMRGSAGKSDTAKRSSDDE